jgi:hypothetical protein
LAELLWARALRVGERLNLDAALWQRRFLRLGAPPQPAGVLLLRTDSSR